MHQPIQEYLEDYLRDPQDNKIPPEFRAHLAECRACASEVGTLEIHNRLLQMLRVKDDPEPRAGFYARVLSRVEEGKADSFWGVFLEPAFGRRLAFACAALVLLMGTYLVTAEPGSNADNQPGIADMKSAPQMDDGSVQPQQRDAVLVNLASYHE